MSRMPEPIAEFLRGRRFAVAGVSRNPKQTANYIFRKFQSAGYEVIPVNPNATELEGVPCYPDVSSVPGPLDGVMIATSPQVAPQIVRQCAEKGVPRVWFHRSLGAGSTSREALEECRARGVRYIASGCPLMYCEPVDPAHRCMRWLLTVTGRLPR